MSETHEHSHWTGRRILTELADAPTRRRILTAFWKHAEPQPRHTVTAYLAKTLHFRDETIRKAPAEKKADWLATRVNDPAFEEFLEMALMVYHTTSQQELLGAFLDSWEVPHVNGSIEVDEYKVPDSAKVQQAVESLSQFPARDVAIYLATAGALMGDEWAHSTDAAVASLASSLPKS